MATVNNPIERQLDIMLSKLKNQLVEYEHPYTETAWGFMQTSTETLYLCSSLGYLQHAICMIVVSTTVSCHTAVDAPVENQNFATMDIIGEFNLLLIIVRRHKHAPTAVTRTDQFGR